MAWIEAYYCECGRGICGSVDPPADPKGKRKSASLDHSRNNMGLRKERKRGERGLDVKRDADTVEVLQVKKFVEKSLI